MNDEAAFNSRSRTENLSAEVRTAVPLSKRWIPLILIVVGMIAFAVNGSTWLQSLTLTGQLNSMGVDVVTLPTGGLKVTARQTSITGRDLQQIAQMPDVTHLDLFGCQAIAADGFTHLESMTSLRKLNLSGTQINDLQPLTSCTQLESLALDRSPIQGASLKVLSDRISLRLLSANESALDDDSLRLLDSATNLEALYLANTQVTGKFLPLLSRFPRLQKLNLSGTKLTDDDLVSDNWPEMPILDQLFLNDLPITDKGFADFQITVEEKLPSLSALGLSNTKITSVSLRFIAALPQLKTIRLSGTPIPREDIEELRLEMSDSYIEGN